MGLNVPEGIIVLSRPAIIKFAVFFCHLFDSCPDVTGVCLRFDEKKITLENAHILLISIKVYINEHNYVLYNNFNFRRGLTY